MNNKKRTEELIKYLANIKDADGCAVVNVTLKDDIYNPLGTDDNRDLNDEIYDYIETQTNIVPSEIPLKIRFHGDMNTEEQSKIKDAMKKHYTLKSLDLSWDLAANFRKALLLIIFGVAMLALYFYFSFTSDRYFFTEILSIIGSFSLWEAADALLLERPGLKREVKNIEQNLNQKVEFVCGSRSVGSDAEK